MDRSPPSPEAHRKLSCDLQSRLKTRKLLGVGTTEDGDVHRSKLSQILGHSEQLHVKMPKGLRSWLWCLCVIFSAIGGTSLLFPGLTFNLLLRVSLSEDCSLLPARLFGAALLGLAAVQWASADSTDKEVVRWAILSSGAFFAAQAIVLGLNFHSLTALGPVLLLALHVAAVGASAYFYFALTLRAPQYRGRRSVDLKAMRLESKLS